MKKIYQTSFFYMILALIGGVFYREFTKFSNFSGDTTLSFLHVHLFVLGMVFFLIVLLFNKTYHLFDDKRFHRFYYTYNSGLLITVIMLAIRGVLQVRGDVLSKALDASISGIAGLGHIILGIGLLMFFLLLKSYIKED